VGVDRSEAGSGHADDLRTHGADRVVKDLYDLMATA
jgi:hypothetical protein